MEITGDNQRFPYCLAVVYGKFPGVPIGDRRAIRKCQESTTITASQAQKALLRIDGILDLSYLPE